MCDVSSIVFVVPTYASSFLPKAFIQSVALLNLCWPHLSFSPIQSFFAYEYFSAVNSKLPLANSGFINFYQSVEDFSASLRYL
jgi:hypothetical protein